MEKDLLTRSGLCIMPDYGEAYLRLVSVLLVAVVAVVSTSGTGESLREPSFYLRFFPALAGVTLIHEWVRFITRLLDRVYDWEHRGVIRLILQIALGVICPIVIELLLCMLWLLLSGLTIGEAFFIQYFFFLSLLVIVIFNSYYFVYYIYNYWRLKSVIYPVTPFGEELPNNTAQGLQVYSGGVVRHYLDTEILYIYRQDNYNYVKTTKDATTYMVSRSLGDIEKELDKDTFFRLNRQIIVNRTCIQGYTPAEYSKIKVSVSPLCPFGGTVVVSQRRAPVFREWWNED